MSFNKWLLLERAIEDPNIGAGELATLAVLMKYAYDSCEVWPTAQTIGKALNKTRQTISKCLMNLEAAGYISSISVKKRQNKKWNINKLDEFNEKSGSVIKSDNSSNVKNINTLKYPSVNKCNSSSVNKFNTNTTQILKHSSPTSQAKILNIKPRTGQGGLSNKNIEISNLAVNFIFSDIEKDKEAKQLKIVGFS